MPAGSEGVRDREMFAVFREETTLAAGDPYKDPDPIPSRYKGKQFGVPFQPKGCGPDAMIDKTTPLRVAGDTYLSPHEVQKKLRNSGKNITDKPFRPSAPCPKSSGPGSTYGLIGPPILDTDPSMAARTSSNIKAIGKRNIYAGKYVPGPDQGTKYMANAYAPGAEISRKLRQEAKAKILKPFVAMGRTGKGIALTTNYSGGGPERVRPHTTGSIPKAWKASGVSQTGRGDYGCLSRLQYVPQMDQGPRRKDKEGAKAFVPPGSMHNRLSMWSPNAYAYESRPAVNNDMSLLG